MHALLCQCGIRHFIGGHNVNKNRALKQIGVARVRMFNITFNSSLLIMWWSVLFVEENLKYWTMMTHLWYGFFIIGLITFFWSENFLKEQIWPKISRNQNSFIETSFCPKKFWKLINKLSVINYNWNLNYSNFKNCSKFFPPSNLVNVIKNKWQN